MTNQNTLDGKAAQIQAELQIWVAEQGILSKGEVLVYSLRIETGHGTGSVVERDPLDALVPPALTINGTCEGSFRGKFLGPAALSQEEAEELIHLVQAGQARNGLRELLIEKRNVPSDTLFSGSSVPAVNKGLETGFKGKFYRLAKGNFDGRERLWQLWEVKPKAS